MITTGMVAAAEGMTAVTLVDHQEIGTVAMEEAVRTGTTVVVVIVTTLVTVTLVNVTSDNAI